MPEDVFSVSGVHVVEDERAVEDKCFINDFQFMQDLKRIKELRSFLLQEAVSPAPEDESTLNFGRLNLLRYGPNGRAPNEDEWSAVEYHTQAMFKLLTEPMRRRFILGEVPTWMSILPIALAVVALGSLLGAMWQWKTESAINVLFFYTLWLMSLGSMGSIAFLGMNALSVQQDVTFDVSNRRLMLLRIALGALFGLVLTLPFGFHGFLDFLTTITTGKSDHAPSPSTPITSQAMFLLLPFILGFSTTLVIMILNRMIDAVQAFFGKSGTERTTAPATVAPAVPVPPPLPGPKPLSR